MDINNTVNFVDSMFTLCIALDGNFIIWYFKTIMESGISRFNLILGKVSHLYQQQIQRIESQEAVQELDYELPHHTKVCLLLFI